MTAITVAGLGVALVPATPSSAQPHAGRWTWTLYERGGALALANEIPDTPQLAAVLECTPGSGAAKVSVFPAPGTDKPPVERAYRTSEPEFAAFVSSGNLSFAVEGGSGQIAMASEHRDKLERFARQCGS